MKKIRILVVEDESLVGMLIEDVLTRMGHDVVAVASRMEEAINLARTSSFDLAIVDINLDGQSSYPVADILRCRRIPFMFATGYGKVGLRQDYAGTPTLTKPFVDSDLIRLVSQIVEGQC